MKQQNKMNTKKEILLHLSERIAKISYDIAYHGYKGDDTIKFNLLSERKLIISICTSIGVKNEMIDDWISKGNNELDKDIQATN